MKTLTSTKFFVNVLKFATLFGIGIFLVFLFYTLTNSAQQTGTAIPTDKTGEVLLITDSGDSIGSLVIQKPLRPGDQLVSSLKSAALVSFFNDGATLAMYPNTSFVINEIGMRGEHPYAEIQLIQGQVEISTRSGIIGVRNLSGMAAVGGESSVLEVSAASQLPNTFTASCQTGSCAVQKDEVTYNLAAGQLVSMQTEGAPEFAAIDSAVASDVFQNIPDTQYLSDPESNNVTSAGSNQMAAENNSDSEQSAPFQALEGNLQSNPNSSVELEYDQVLGQQIDTQGSGAPTPTFSVQTALERSAPLAIPGGPWYLVSLGNDTTLTSQLAESKIMLNFNPNTEEISGFSGCNNFSARLVITNGEIKIKNITSTRVSCPKSISTMENTFINLLRRISNWNMLGGDRLEFSTKSGDSLAFSLANPGGETETIIRPTFEPPTATPLPTSTPAPTATPLPTATSKPSDPVSNAFYVSPSGNDGNPGTSQLPWRTIDKAAKTLSSGQTAIVLEGTYPERIVLSNNGITLQAQGKVVMQGFTINGDSNKVIGFIISDKTENAGVYVRGDGNLVKDNEIYHMKQDGIWFFGSNNIYRGNFIHDILDPSISSDYHADCFQTWAGYGQVNNTLFEGNTCDHNRISGSNQIFMVEAQSTAINSLTIRGNTFIMYDSGYSPLNIDRKDGQYPISSIIIQNNRFENVSGSGSYAIRLVQVTGGEISGNVVVGYDTVWRNDGSSSIAVSGNVMQ